MFYRFSNLAGRVVASSQLAAYRPQGIQVFAGIAKQPVYTSRKEQPVRLSSHEVQPGKLDPVLTTYETMTPRQRQVQHAIDETFVWKSFGTDVIGYYATFAVVLGAIAYTGYKLYLTIAPKKND